MHADGIEQPSTECDSRRDGTVQISRHGLTIQFLQHREVPADEEYLPIENSLSITALHKPDSRSCGLQAVGCLSLCSSRSVLELLRLRDREMIARLREELKLSMQRYAESSKSGVAQGSALQRALQRCTSL